MLLRMEEAGKGAAKRGAWVQRQAQIKAEWHSCQARQREVYVAN
jgi:hypothetical protein